MRAETYGKEMMLYNNPIRIPISLMSEIWAMQGTMSALNAPEKRPYSAAYTASGTSACAADQRTSVDSPARAAQGTRSAKRPNASAKCGGAIRPSTLPALSTAST